MHRYGGMYADLDMEALRDLGPILGKETRPVFSAMQVPPAAALARASSCCHRPQGPCRQRLASKRLQSRVPSWDPLWWGPTALFSQALGLGDLSGLETAQLSSQNFHVTLHAVPSEGLDCCE